MQNSTTAFTIVQFPVVVRVQRYFTTVYSIFPVSTHLPIKGASIDFAFSLSLVFLFFPKTFHLYSPQPRVCVHRGATCCCSCSASVTVRHGRSLSPPSVVLRPKESSAFFFFFFLNVAFFFFNRKSRLSPAGGPSTLRTQRVSVESPAALNRNHSSSSSSCRRCVVVVVLFLGLSRWQQVKVGHQPGKRSRGPLGWGGSRGVSGGGGLVLHASLLLLAGLTHRVLDGPHDAAEGSRETGNTAAASRRADGFC